MTESHALAIMKNIPSDEYTMSEKLDALRVMIHSDRAMYATKTELFNVIIYLMSDVIDG